MDNLSQFYAALGSNIRRARSDRDITQQDLADELDLNRTSITNIEKGKQKILVHTLVDLMEVLKVGFTDLVPSVQKQQRITGVEDLLVDGFTKQEEDFLRSVLGGKQSTVKNNEPKKSHRKSS